MTHGAFCFIKTRRVIGSRGDGLEKNERAGEKYLLDNFSHLTVHLHPPFSAELPIMNDPTPRHRISASLQNEYCSENVTLLPLKSCNGRAANPTGLAMPRSLYP